MVRNSLPRSPKSMAAAKATNVVPLLLLVPLIVLAGCSSTSDSASDMGGKGSKVKVTPGKGGGSTSTTGGSTTPPPTPTLAPPPPTTSAVAYDTSVGNGVDAAGFADLPLRSGAHRYFVSSSSGSDGNDCAAATNPATPKASLASARACVADGNGDQVLVAEGTTYSESLQRYFNDKSGFSQVYPTVLQSYDPADPLNEAKYGRASDGNRPVLTTSDRAATQLVSGAGAPTNYFAVRGFDINPGNVPGESLQVLDRTGNTNYVLFENDLFRYTMLTRTADNTAVTARSFIVRNSAFYGSWNTSGYTQGVYSRSTIGTTVEDCVFWHNGWKIGARRGDDQSIGGLMGGTAYMKNHPVYLQNDDRNTIYRRNLIIDGAADGGHVLGDALVTENVIIDAPIGLSVGGGTSYSTIRPEGVHLEISYNAIIGGADAEGGSVTVGSTGIWVANGTPDSSAHHNLMIRSNALPSDWTGPAFRTWSASGETNPSYMNWHDNVAYLRSQPGLSVFEAVNGGSVTATYNNNVWDNAASGTNGNSSAGNFPKPYTMDELFSALGVSGATEAARKQAFINYAIDHPEQHLARNIRALLFAGYGME